MTRKFIYKLFACVLCLCWATQTASASITPQSYSLDVTFDPEQSYMEGTARMSFEEDPLPDSLVFYLHGELTVDIATAGDSELDGKLTKTYFYWDYSLVAVRVALATTNIGRDDLVTVSYKGYFHPSKARTPSDYMRIDKDGVFLRSFGYSLWFPVFMEPDKDPGRTDFDQVVIRTPEKYRAVFAGERLSEEVVDGTRIARWSAPGTRIFDAQCTARPFEELADGGVHALFLPNESSRVNAGVIQDFSARAVSFFAKNYKSGILPSQTFVVEMPRFGDISSNNMTGLATDRWRNFIHSYGAQETVAHELVHPFVFLSVPLDDPIYALVLEGFPSYFHYPFLESCLGAGWYDSLMEEIEQDYRRKRETGVTLRGNELPPEVPLIDIAPDKIGLYKDTFVLADRAVLFFHDLRCRLGEDRFDTFTQELFSKDEITLESFMRLVEEHGPDEVDAVHTWLASTEFPDSFSVTVHK